MLEMILLEITEKRNDLSMLFAREAHKDIISPDEYHNSCRDLHPVQREIIMYNHSWCKSTINNLRNVKWFEKL